MDNNELIELTKKARENSHSPISNYKVGAALLTKEGKVFLGCNIEDPSGIGVTNICAERCAIVKAISDGYKEFDTIAVVGGREDCNEECLPCGVCRQFLNSICPNIKILSYDNGIIKTYELNDLLPHAFNEKVNN